MHCKYVGLRHADGTCAITRVDTTRIARLLIFGLPVGRAGLTVDMSFGLLYPEAPGFAWGDLSRESLASATCILTDALPDYRVSLALSVCYLEEMVRHLPPDGWTLDWVDVWEWFASTQDSVTPELLKQLDTWMGEI